MASQKLVLSLLIVAIAAVISQVNSKPQVDLYAANNTNKSHNLIVGSRLPGDRLTLRENIIKKSAWMQVVTVEKTFSVLKGQQITLINALDQKTNGNGAHATLVQGGPGRNNVTLRFKSERGHGINFVVELYSRY